MIYKKSFLLIITSILIIITLVFFYFKKQEIVLPAEYHNFSDDEIEYKIISTILSFTDVEQEFTVQFSDSLAIIEGDIIIGTVQDFEESKLAVRTGHGILWKKGIVPYYIPKNNSYKESINVAIQELNKQTNLNLIERTDENDYLCFFEKSGYSSWIGKQGGKQNVNIGGTNKASIKHEIIHAIGFYHEQSRTDRDKYVQINLKNVKKRSRHNFKKYIDKRGHTGTDIGTYDYNSIMHYSAYAFSKRKNKKTIIVRVPPATENTTIGQRNKLSEGDIKSINSIYPKN